jgi:HD superfamily phosphohydrolase YqeK
LIDNLLSVFSSGYTTLAVFLLIAVFEFKFSLHLSETYRQYIRAATLILLGCFFIAFHRHIVTEDIFIDMRGVGVALAVLFGGVWLGAITTLTEILIRIGLGGSAVLADALGLILDLLLSLFVLKLFVRDTTRIYISHIFYAGIAVGVGEAVALLFIMPSALGISLFKGVGLDVFLIQLIGVCLFGWLLKNQDDRMRGRNHGRARIQELHETMKLGLAALSTAMAHHDLSTAGHEQRVADLAVRVGKAMGLNRNRLEGLQMAAIVHDVGQIRVPREIITRPRKLSPEEFEMVKLHVEAGYQILKDIHFPWPIADIVRQHHEHIDGSGYPNGLTEVQLLLESKILHVCDSLEAMTSHRPFRRAYSIEKALEELNRYKGTRYDSLAVEVCERLFRDEGYVFPSFKKEAAL